MNPFTTLLLIVGTAPFAVDSFQTVPSLGLAKKKTATISTGNAAISSRLFQSNQNLLKLRASATSNADVKNDPKQEQDNVGAWIPIGSAEALGDLGPQQITVMGLDLVVWKKEEAKNQNEKNNDGDDASSMWSVLMDECPHRLAPLSQGRIDPETNCIECPYHGWQFDTDGTLTALPQLDEGKDVKQIQKVNSAKSLPVHVAGDLIFAFLPPSVHGEMFPQSFLPEQMFPTVKEDMDNNATFYVRELPYSADFLIENFMDPAHIPFAHHKLQSVREEGSPIPMEVVANNFTHVEVSFEDVSRGKERTGVVSFQRPSMYHFRTKQDDGLFRTNLNIHIVPVHAGRSRVIFKGFSFWWVPTWLAHAGSNRFLNTDTWLHDAEIAARRRSQNQLAYKYASNSDIGVLTFRKWWKENGFSTSPPNTYGPSSFDDLTKLSRPEQINPWEYHSKHCSKCRKALKVMKKVKMGGYIVTVASAIFLKKWPVRAAILASLAMYTSYMSSKAATVIEGNPHISGYGDRSAAAAAA